MADAKTPETGARLGRYRLLERIGSGGMAEVFRATTEGAQGFVREVCIKKILPAFAGETEFVRMFVHEAQITGRLQHANIATVFDFAEHEGAHFLVMELVDGPDLRRLLTATAAAREAMPIDVALYITRGMLDALHYAHGRTDTDGQSLDLVHRDISPHNVLVSYAGEVKLTDFGIAKARTLGLRTKTGQIKGKLAYMAPEQALGRAVDARTDLWAVGVVLFEMLASERPFQATTDVELSAAIMTGRAVPLSRFRRDVPKPVEQLVASLLSVDAAQRPQSAAHAIAALQQAIRDSSITPATSLELAALVTRVVPRTRRAPSLPPARDPTELLPGVAGNRSPAPVYRVAGPQEPTGTYGERVDPYEATAAGAGLGVRLSVEPLRGSLTSIDPAPIGASPVPASAHRDAPPAHQATAPARPAAVASSPVPASAASPLPTSHPTPVATVAAPAPPAAFLSAPAARVSDGPRQSDRALSPASSPKSATPASTWASQSDAPPPRGASWTAGAPRRSMSQRSSLETERVPLTRRPLFVVFAFIGFLVLGLVGGAAAWYVLKGRRLRRPARPAVTHAMLVGPRAAALALGAMPSQPRRASTSTSRT